MVTFIWHKVTAVPFPVLSMTNWLSHCASWFQNWFMILFIWLLCEFQFWSWPPKLLPGLKTGSWSHSWSCSFYCCPSFRSWPTSSNLLCCLVSKLVHGQVHLTALPVSDFKTGSRYCSSDCCPSIWSWPTSPKLLPGLKTSSWSHSWSCSSDCCAIPNTGSWCCLV